MPYSIFVTLLFSFTVLLTEPEWIDYNSRKNSFPENEYFVGFSSRYFEDGEDINEVQKEVKLMSRMELSESVYVSVSGQSSMNINTEDGSTNTRFEKTSMTKSSMETFGLKTEVYLDEEKKVAYSFSFIKRKVLAAGYFKKFYDIMKEIKSIMKTVDEIKGNEGQYEALSKAMNFLNKLDNDESVLVFLGVSQSVLLGDDRKYFKSVIREKLNAIRSDENQSIGQLAQYLLDDMNHELGGKDFTFSLSPITYKNTGITSEFSDYFHQIVKAKAANKYNVMESFDANLRLTGSYWPREKEIQITFNLHEYDGDEPMFQKFGGSISLELVEVQNLDLVFDIKDDIDLKQHNDLLNPVVTSGGMKARIVTQKGAQALIFREGEQLKLHVQVSRPSYIRLVNVWSDGTQLSLLENFYIGKEKVNELVELPFDWETACPCGTEYIKLLAQSDPFTRINIVSKDGLDYIDEQMSEVLSKTRGFQQAKADNEGFYFAESGFSVTTLPRN